MIVRRDFAAIAGKLQRYVLPLPVFTEGRNRQLREMEAPELFLFPAVIYVVLFARIIKFPWEESP